MTTKRSSLDREIDCFGLKDHRCTTPNCPYARDCIKAVWDNQGRRVGSKYCDDMDDAELFSMSLELKDFHSIPRPDYQEDAASLMVNISFIIVGMILGGFFGG